MQAFLKARYTVRMATKMNALFNWTSHSLKFKDFHEQLSHNFLQFGAMDNYSE